MPLDPESPANEAAKVADAPVGQTSAPADQAESPDAGKTPLEQELGRREEICERAEAVAAERDWHHGPGDLRMLMDEWRSLRRWHDPREDELQRRFDAARESFYAARDDAREQAKATKERLLAEAERISKSDQWKATGNRFREIMDEWKAAGSAGHDTDEELWGRLGAARSEFFSRRKAHFAELDEQRARAKGAKEKLVEEAKAAAVTSEDWTGAQWRAASARMRELMDRWKAAGVAERADNDRLWEEFRAARQPFFDAQHAHYEAVEAAQREAAEAKERLVQAACELADGHDFSREATERAKELDREWKKVGFAGRELNDELWDRFRTAKESFWDQKRAYNEQRHEDWVRRTQDAVDRRKRRIANLQEQVDRLQERLNNAYATDHVEEMQDRIDEKREIIKDLEDEVRDIESRLDG